MMGNWWNYGNYPYGMMNDYYGAGGLGFIMMIFWWVLIIAVIVLIVKWGTREFRHRGIYEKSPLEILKERYAKGEVTREEYLEIKKELEK